MLLILNQLCYSEIFRIEIFRIIFAKIFVKIVFLFDNQQEISQNHTDYGMANGNCFPKNRKLFENISYFWGNVIIFAAINR